MAGAAAVRLAASHLALGAWLRTSSCTRPLRSGPLPSRAASRLAHLPPAPGRPRLPGRPARALPRTSPGLPARRC
eukprot:6477741-Alexandrium_andersonii.AAC.1